MTAAEKLARIIEGEHFGQYSEALTAETIENAKLLLDTLSEAGARLIFAPETDAIQQALDYEREAFENDKPVNAGDLVDWFVAWRADAKAALAS